MMLSNVALQEILGLLKKEPNGLFSLGPNATKRIVFMYGDALSVSLYGTLYDKILRNITHWKQSVSSHVAWGTGAHLHSGGSFSPTDAPPWRHLYTIWGYIHATIPVSEWDWEGDMWSSEEWVPMSREIHRETNCLQPVYAAMFLRVPVYGEDKNRLSWYQRLTFTFYSGN